MTTRAVVILIENDAVALIERHRDDRHYFTFPGGGVDEGETPEQAAVREAREELGLDLVLRKLVAEIWFMGKPQFYYLAEAVGGTFGTGSGPEMVAPFTGHGTYRAVWMPIDEILDQPVLPRPMAELLVRARPRAGPPLILSSTKTMHILLIHQAFAALDEPGGTRHAEFARLLAGRGHRVTVIASQVSYLTGQASPAAPPPAGMPSEDGGQVRILRARAHQALHPSFVRRVFAFLSFMVSSFFLGLGVKNVDLVWGTSPPIFQGATAWLLARLKGVPFLFEVRDLWPEFAIAVGVLKNPLLIRLSLWLERFLYRRADRMIVNSPAYVKHVTGRGARRVDLVPNGADPEMFDPADEGTAFRSAHGLAGKFVVLYAGAHGMSNDLGVVLECASLLRGSAPHVQIVLLGDGKEKTALQEQAQEMELPNVTFLPPCAKNEMPSALAGADACLAILKPLEAYKTTYPNKVFDYMAAGRPVILAIDGVIREVVETAGCGVFARPGDPAALAEAIRALAAEGARARKRGLRGRAFLEAHFSRAVVAEKLLHLLAEITSGSPS